MTDKELLTLAAKAAGGVYRYTGIIRDGEFAKWNPLGDDGDALRLAVKLEIDVMFWLGFVSADVPEQEQTLQEEYSIHDDPYAATRRAIVRAAAEIGKSL